MVYAQNNTFPETGNVGIGTEDPSVNLEVKGTTKLDSNFYIKNFRAKSLELSKETNYLTIDNDGKIVVKKGTIVLADPAPLNPCAKYLDANGYMSVPHPQWFSDVNKLFTACNSVFVGINTLTPRVHLDVLGTTYSKKISLGMADPLLGNVATSPHFHLKADNGSPFANQTVFLVENADRKLFQIQNDGLVRAREIKVDLATNWPDYVFQPSYPLMPLMEVKTYVEANGHLPNVPDACEVEEEGIALGEMNRILLEKVEELTLYMIQMQEEQERLKLELEELKMQNLGR